MINPGYGFLSENAAFAKLLEESGGLTFMGPPSAAIDAMGARVRARNYACCWCTVRSGLPWEGAGREFLAEEAEKIGYPVTDQGCQGRWWEGYEDCRYRSRFEDALSSAQREALKSFGDATVLIEKYLTAPRHVEVQVFADSPTVTRYTSRNATVPSNDVIRRSSRKPRPTPPEALRKRAG